MTILSLRDQASALDERLKSRLEDVVPMLMARAGVDAWVLTAREYNEDPVVATMLPATWLSARRRTILVFSRKGPLVERFTVSRYAMPGLFVTAWDPEGEPDQFAALARLLDDLNPGTIAINTSTTFAVADGLTSSEADRMIEALPDRLSDRVVSGENLAVGWFETRTPEEISQLRDSCSIAHGFLAEALSASVITPGVTTTEDVVWWLRQSVSDAGLGAWFHPTVDVQRSGDAGPDSFATPQGGRLIEPGDLIHIDFGITYLGLATDQQQHGYVMLPGESGPPAGLVAALEVGNRLQDLLMAEFVSGRTGNEILAATRSAASVAGIDGLIYTHPIGTHGHGAGPTVGLWDRQDGVPGAGDYPLYPNTAYSIELMAKVAVPEWNETVSIMLEEDAIFDGASVSFLDGRQTGLHLI